MKKTVTVLVIFIFLSILLLAIYSAKKDSYNNQKEFYKSNFTGRITGIVEGRGTKVYYDSIHFFYTSFCENESAVIKAISVGDVIRKNDSIIEFYRVDEDYNSSKIATSRVTKPAATYFSYFTGF